MLSPKTKIGLLLAAHIVGGLILAWIGRLTNAEIAVAGLFAPTFAGAGLFDIGILALCIADTGLLAMWGGLGAMHFVWRFSAVMVATICVCVFSFAVLEIMPHWLQRVFVRIVPLTALYVLIALSALRHGGRQIRLIKLAVESPVPTGFQFSLRRMLCVTAMLAVVLGIVRVAWGDGALNSSERWSVAIFALCFTVVELAILWAALGSGRPALRLAVVLPTAFVVGAVSSCMVLSLTDIVLWSAVAGLQAFITAASLLVVRSCGWRLVRGGGVQVSKQILPEDQGSGNVAASR